MFRVEDAWPRPQLSWRLDTAEGGAEESLASGGQEWVESSQEAASPHLVTVTRSLAYTARLAEDGANLTCIVTQVNILDIQRIYPHYLPVTPGGGRPGDRAAAQCAAPGAARHCAQEQRRHGACQQGEDHVIYVITEASCSYLYLQGGPGQSHLREPAGGGTGAGHGHHAWAAAEVRTLL